jgi:hypothetical protein
MQLSIHVLWERRGCSHRLKHVIWATTDEGDVRFYNEGYVVEPQVMHILVPEAFGVSGGAFIAARLISERLPEALRMAEERERNYYGRVTPQEIEPMLNMYRQFVSLCERLEKEQGAAVRMTVTW